MLINTTVIIMIMFKNSAKNTKQNINLTYSERYVITKTEAIIV